MTAEERLDMVYIIRDIVGLVVSFPFIILLVIVGVVGRWLND